MAETQTIQFTYHLADNKDLVGSCGIDPFPYESPDLRDQQIWKLYLFERIIEPDAPWSSCQKFAYLKKIDGQWQIGDIIDGRFQSILDDKFLEFLKGLIRERYPELQ